MTIGQSLGIFPESSVHVQSKIKGNEKRRKFKRTFLEVTIASKIIINQKYESFPGQVHIHRNGAERQWRKYNKRNMKVAFFHIFGENLIAFQNIRNLRASEAKDIFIGMVQESEIFEYLETGQHHITLPWKEYFKISATLL